jgi:lysylphosphatidylglycerol synthetase-like protein (DUF2156 family)
LPVPQIELHLGRLEPIAALATLAIALVTVFLALRHAPARNLRTPALISSVLVLPFMTLEFVNRRAFDEGLPVPLFAIMWLLPLSFILILMPIVRNLRAQERSTANPLSSLLGVVCLILLAWLWVGIIHDQMPCFLGVPNCD